LYKDQYTFLIVSPSFILTLVIPMYIWTYKCEINCDVLDSMTLAFINPSFILRIRNVTKVYTKLKPIFYLFI